MAQIVVEHRDDLQRGRITAVSSGGWRVEICGPNVTVPSQDSAGKSLDDLAGLLIAAYTMAGTAINHGVGSLAHLRGSLPEPLVAGLVDVLTAAAKIADRHWNRASRDIYHCLGEAWRHAGMAVPYTLLVAALRAALPPATTLCDFNNEANPLSVRALFDDAIAALKHGVTTAHVA